jgi:hypothetical protein
MIHAAIFLVGLRACKAGALPLESHPQSSIILSKIIKLTESESTMLVPRGWKAGKEQLHNDTKFWLYKMRKF